MTRLHRNLEIIFLLTVLIIGLFIRLYRFTNPIADWHSWRQADTSSVSRNFVTHGFDLLHPRMNNISNVQSGFENPRGYFYVEFPLYDAAQAGLFMAFGHLTIEEWGRLITIFASLMGSVFLFLLLRRRNRIVSWFTLIFAVFLPFNIYYGRTILPDTSMVAAMLGGIYFFDKYLIGDIPPMLKLRWKGKLGIRNPLWLFLSLLFVAVALLLKPYAIFYSLPLFYLVWKKFGIRLFFQVELWLYAIMAILPLILWRVWMLKYPEGIPVSAWLFNGNGIRFHPSFFRWIFYERLAKLISGYVNVLFLVTGIVGIWKEKSEKWFLYSFLLSALLYICIIATGNVQHDYYQIVIMPAIVIAMGYGASWSIMFLKKFIDQNTAYAIVILLTLVGFWVSWQQVKDYFNINNPAIVIAGKAVDRLTPKNAKIIAPYDGDSSFLYQTNRQGWTSFEHDLPTLVRMGANYLVLVNPKPQDAGIGKTYKIVAQSKDYILFDLYKKP